MLIEQDVDTENGVVSAYVNSLSAHNDSENFIPHDVYTNGSFLLAIKTNHSQHKEISFTRKGNLSIHLKFAADMAVNQIAYVVGICHSTFEITADRNIITNYSY